MATPERANSLVSRGADSLQHCFSLIPPMVLCLVRHINRDMAEMTTPPSIEHCVVELQSYFQPCIDASRVVDRCLPGSRLRLQFGKAMDINAGASSSLLNVYIFAVDQVYSRPRLLAHVVREWRAQLERTNHEVSPFVMLYHQDLVDAACVSARQASGVYIADAAKKPNQKKADAAAAALEPYYEELKALKFAPHQMCAYLPNEAPIRVVERLRAAYAERTSRLSTVFDDYRQKQLRRVSNSVADGTATAVLRLHECWRKGYDLAFHYLQFGVVEDAMVVFARMFDQYYYHSEDYGFAEHRSSLERLGKLPNLFDPSAFPVGKNGYPSALQDDAELVDGLLFIAGCEMRCALLLGRRETAFARYKSVLQVARENFTEEGMTRVSDAWGLFFLLRCALSALRLNWVVGDAGCSGSNGGAGVGGGVSVSLPASPGPRPVDTNATAFHQLPEAQRQSSPTLSGALSASVNQDWSAFAASPDMPSSFSAFPLIDGASTEKISHDAVTERLQVLSQAVGVVLGGELCRKGDLLARLTGDTLEYLMDLAGILGYCDTGKIAAPMTPSSVDAAALGMPELATAEAYVSFYRTLVEMSALCFCPLNDRHLEHVLYYRLAHSYRNAEPSVTAELCRQRLIPFFLHNGWLQLQTVIHCLHVESMDLVVQQREESGEALLSNEEAVALKESLLHIIGGLGECGAQQEELAYLCRRQSPVKWWCRLKQIDRKLGRCSSATDVPLYSLSGLLKDTQVFCVHCNHLLEGAREQAHDTLTTGLRAKIGETVLLCFNATSPVDMMRRQTDEGLSDTGATLTATLVSKKDWGDADEPTHVVLVRKVVSTSHDEAKRELHWVWEFQPCRAGDYRLRCITLQLSEATTLVYVPRESTTLSGGNRTEFLAASAGVGISGRVKAAPRCLLSVPEPDIGIKLRVEPPEEPHCFGDTLAFFAVHVEVERPLYLPQGADATSRGCKNCTFETDGPWSPFTSPAAAAALSTVGAVKGAPTPRDPRHTIMEVVPLLDPSTLARIYVSRPRRQALLRGNAFGASIAFMPSKSIKESSLMPQQHDASHRRPDIADVGGTDGPIAFGDSMVNLPLTLVSITDEKTGVSTTIPVDEEFLMSHLPPLVRESSRRTESVNHSAVSMHLEGSILPLPRFQCCFNICLDDNDEAQKQQQQQQHQQQSVKESRAGLLEATSLRCWLPLVPIFMSSIDECAQVSLSCQRNMESCTTSVSVPFRFAPAFSVRYAFKCFQSRLYCLVQVENVLSKTSLWLRGALLDLLESESYYELARVSSTHDHIMKREWKPHETVHLFFELAPSSEPRTHEKEVRHRVRLQLLYSNWAIAEKRQPLESHILRPLPSSSSGCGGGGVAPSATISSANSSFEVTAGGAYHLVPGNSLCNSLRDEPIYSTKQPRIRYDSAQLELLRTTCNTFHGPIGTFTSKHSCLFNAVIFVDPLNPANQSVRAVATAAAVLRRGSDSFIPGAIPIGASPIDLPGGFVFPVGEPVCFSVTLEPLAHNWPDDCGCEEEFLITFKADPAVWLVTGKQRLRCALSMMEDTTMFFTAVPVPPIPGTTAEHHDSSLSPQREQQQTQQQQQQTQQQQQQQQHKVSTVTTPTIELQWASRRNSGGADTAAVAIEVVQFRTSMRIQH